jgi:hypothetical protein
MPDYLFSKEHFLNVTSNNIEIFGPELDLLLSNKNKNISKKQIADC